MTIDKQEIKALALACEPARCADEADESRRLDEFYSELTPETVLALLAEIERVTKRLCVCRDCGGQGEVYSGRDSYQGWHQPPEPEMDVCGTCGGDGVLGPLEDFEALAGERDQLKAENEDLRKALGDLLSLYEDDEGCRSLPEYIAGRAAMAKEASHG